VEAFESRGAIAFGGEAVFDAEVMVKSMRPEARVKVRTGEHGTESVTNGLVSTFNGAILVRRVGAGGIDSIVELLKESNNERILVEFATLVKDYILVINSRGVFGQPSAEPIEGGTFRYTGGANKERGGMIGEENVTGFARKAGVGTLSFGVLGLLTGEGKVNAEALERYGGFAGRIMAGRLVGCLQSLAAMQMGHWSRMGSWCLKAGTLSM
jgi:hypothetical protein